MAKLCPKLSENQINELKTKLKRPTDAAELKRVQAVLTLNDNEKIEKIEMLTGLKRSRIFGLRLLYLIKGIKALETKPKKSKSLLTKKQLKETKKTLTTKKPQEFGYDCPFWTTGILGDLIEREYGVKYKSKTSLYLIFREAKFTYHKPGRVYRNQDPEEVKKWRKETKPIVKAAFKDKETVILAEDEMILSTQTTFQKIWLPEGEYPRVEISNIRKNRSVYGFLNIKTGEEHSFKTEWQNMFETVKILKKIRKIYSKKNLLVLWDGAGWHRGSKTQEFIKKDKNIKTLYFPKYTPEENPQEHIWKNGRNQITHNRFIENIDRATDEFITYLNKTRFPYSLLGFSPI